MEQTTPDDISKNQAGQYVVASVGVDVVVRGKKMQRVVHGCNFECVREGG